MKPKITKKIQTLFKSRSGVNLDIGCGSNVQKDGGNWLGMDIRKLPGVDIVHNAEEFPWPLPNASCNKLLASHLLEHIKPWLMIDFMNEAWRVMKPGGQFLIGVPYATSHGMYQDPTHIGFFNESTFTYYDPDYYLYRIYEPLPWKIMRNAFQVTGNMEVILEKRLSRDQKVIDEKKCKAVTP